MDAATYPEVTMLRPGASSAPFFLTGEDNLRVVVRTALAVTITIEGRVLDPCGTVVPFVQTCAVSVTDRSAQIFNFRAGDGWMLDLSARVTIGTPEIGQTYIQIRVARGDSAAAVNIGTLVQGYVTESDDLSYPGLGLKASVEGPGFVRRFGISNPAAGNNFTITVPARTRWRLLAVNCLLVAGAGVANREVVLTLDDGANGFAIIPAGVTQIATESRQYTFFQGAPRGAGTQSLHVIAPLPFAVLMAGFDITSSVVNIQAADQFQNVNALVEEWIED
jgi:hypothetical protein